MLKFYLTLKCYPIKYVDETFSILMHSLLDINWPRNGTGIPLRPYCLHNVSIPICNQFNCDVKYCKCLPSFNDPFLHPSLVLALIIENINVVQLIWGNNLKPCFIETNTIFIHKFFSVSIIHVKVIHCFYLLVWMYICKDISIFGTLWSMLSKVVYNTHSSKKKIYLTYFYS